jgi:hypothetical protein
MRKLAFPAAAGRVAPLRIVLMPGAYQEPEDFERAGFVAARSEYRLEADLEFVAPELGHLLDRSILETLHEEVVLPARAAGVRALWLGGASLGAFIALAYAERRAATLDGLCLIAPYLGNRMVTGEVARAGGLAAWQPRPGAEEDEEWRLWTFLRRLPLPGLEVALGIGRDDRFGHGHGLLAAVLPAGAVSVAAGGHDWPVWLELWRSFLARLAARAAAR